MKNGMDNEGGGRVSTKAALLILMLAGCALTLVGVTRSGQKKGVDLSDRLVGTKRTAMKEECLKSLLKRGFLSKTEVSVMRVEENGSLEEVPSWREDDILGHAARKVRNTIVMDQDKSDADTPQLLVTMADGTKIVVDLNKCAARSVFVPSHPDKDGLWKGKDERDNSGALDVAGDGWEWMGPKKCYKDNQYGGERAVRNIWDDVVMYTNPKMHWGWCRHKCGGYKYAALQFRTECFCGTKLRYQIEAWNSDCWCPCPGNALEDCGCANTMIIHKNNNYQSRCLTFPDHYSKYKNGLESIGFYQIGCTISAHIYRWNNGHYHTPAYVGHMVNDWNQFFLTLSNGEGQWEGWARKDASGKIGSVYWSRGTWAGKTFTYYS